MARTAWLATLGSALISGNLKIRACKNTHLRLRRGCVSGPGRLMVGCQWASGFHRPTHFVIQPGGRCVLDGAFSIFEAGIVWVNSGAMLSLGDGYINSGANISVFKSLSIGDGSVIGENVSIRDADNHSLQDRPDGAQPIVIGKHVWIGMNATILKGVHIGDGAVIGAGAVVTRDVPAGWLAVGVPAKPIRPVTWS
ncbi:MAG: acetyltransferase [Hyphomicrobiales bacterium]|nr:acetyltransferase [Hyphomicrobiales bacterium]